MIKIRYSIFLLIGLIGWHCNSDKAACRYGKPKAIFSLDMPLVEKHSFERKGQEAQEHILLADSSSLMISQRGCDAIRQVYHFELTGDLSQKADSFFINRAIERLNYLSKSSPSHQTLAEISKRVQASPPRLGESIALAEHYYIEIDKVMGNDKSQLLIEMRSE